MALLLAMMRTLLDEGLDPGAVDDAPQPADCAARAAVALHHAVLRRLRAGHGHAGVGQRRPPAPDRPAPRRRDRAPLARRPRARPVRERRLRGLDDARSSPATCSCSTATASPRPRARRGCPSTRQASRPSSAAPDATAPDLGRARDGRRVGARTRSPVRRRPHGGDPSTAASVAVGDGLNRVASRGTRPPCDEKQGV